MQLLLYQNSEWAEITISHKHEVKFILGYISRKSKNKYGFFIVQNFMPKWLYADIYGEIYAQHFYFKLLSAICSEVMSA